ncbi:MAG: hypothetical protein LBI87_06460 [Candidatus Accumulibacter sp.]|jgi:hypothetical protein|nr:hypothetical protein [Accumulibacter sp.]
MSSQFLGVLSGLAYLALCLLIAVSGARRKCPRRDPVQTPSIGQPDERSDGPPPVAPSARFTFLPLLSCLILLSSFLFMPCGTLPSLAPAGGGALAVIGGLAAASALSGGWARPRRRWGALLCLGASLAAIARYAEQRGVPGELYALDAYVAMPILGAAEGMGKPGVCVLAAASLFALWKALPAGRFSAPPGKSWERDAAFFSALAAELWALAAIGFWVCLFFPFSFAWDHASEFSVLGAAALNALVFWGKTLGLKWLMEKPEDRGGTFHAAILFALLGFGAWLLLGAAA